LDGARLLDVHVVPGFESHLRTLLDGVDWPAGPAVFTMSPPTAAYAEALSEVGFSADRRLAEAVAQFAAATPAEVWIRNA
jgi:hypothetical protein